MGDAVITRNEDIVRYLSPLLRRVRVKERTGQNHVNNNKFSLSLSLSLFISLFSPTPARDDVISPVLVRARARGVKERNNPHVGSSDPKITREGPGKPPETEHSLFFLSSCGGHDGHDIQNIA